MKSYLPEGWIIVVTILFIGAAWRYGDWRNWQKYYPSILFIGMWDFITTMLTYQHPLWHFGKSLLSPNHTVADFIVVFLHLMPLVLLYLSRYPYQSKQLGQAVYIFMWVVATSALEAIFVLLHLVTYHNGWNYGWSVLIWVLMFVIIRLHATRPLWAWLSCFLFAYFAIWYFQIPITTMQ